MGCFICSVPGNTIEETNYRRDLCYFYCFNKPQKIGYPTVTEEQVDQRLLDFRQIPELIQLVEIVRNMICDQQLIAKAHKLGIGPPDPMNTDA